MLQLYLIILTGIGSLLWPVGLLLQSCGCVQRKSALSTLLRGLLAMAAAGLCFWAVGAGLLLNTNPGWVSYDRQFLLRQPPDAVSVEFFHLCLALVAPVILAGVVAERATLRVVLLGAAVLGGAVFPILGRLTWFGPLRLRGFVDFGGAGAVHLAAAVFSAVAVAVVGSRLGKFNAAGKSQNLAGHQLPLLGIGAVVSLIGFFASQLGCLLTHWSQDSTIGPGIAVINIMLATSAGALAAVVLSHVRFGKPDYFYIVTGFLGAMSAISPAPVIVSSLGAVTIGVVAGIIVPVTLSLVDDYARFDDPTGWVCIGGVGSLWGLIAVPLLVSFSPNSGVVERLRQLETQLLGIIVITLFTLIAAVVTLVPITLLGRVRVAADVESQGLDPAELGVDSTGADAMV